MQLKDEWTAGGNNYDSLAAELKQMSSKTGVLTITQNSLLQFWSLGEISKSGNRYGFYPLTAEWVRQFKPGRNLSLVNMKLNEETRGLLQELAHTTCFMLHYGNSSFLISRHALSSLCDIIGLKGNSLARPSFARDVLLYQTMLDHQNKAKLRMLYRWEDIDGVRVKKVFAFLKPRYPYEPINVVLPYIKESTNSPLGKGEVKLWHLSHKVLQVYIEFPQQSYADVPQPIAPGLLIQTSDTGHSSLWVRGTFRIGNSRRCVFDEAKWEHNLPLAENSVVEAAFREYIHRTFPAEYEAIPKLLGNKNKRRLQTKKLVSQYTKELELVKAIGKARKKEMMDYIIANAPESVTEYEIIEKIIEYPFPDLPDEARAELSKTLGRAPFIVRKDMAVTWEE